MTWRGDSGTAFAGWCVVGAGATTGVLTLLTVGPFALLVSLMLSALLLWRLDFGWGMAGMISGAGLPVLYVAWLDRGRTGGPLSSPWPAAVAALALLVAGVVVFLVRRGR